VFEEVHKPLRAIFLRGLHPSGDPLGGYSWYPDEGAFYERPEADQAPAIRAEADRIAAFLQQLQTLYPMKIMVTGMSQGGDLTLALAVYYPELVSLAMPCAGRLSPPMRPAQFDKPKDTLPTIHMMQGVDDEIVPVESAREAAAWLVGAGFKATLQEYPDTGHTISDAMVKDIQQLL
jgi:predicted esterase